MVDLHTILTVVKWRGVILGPLFGKRVANRNHMWLMLIHSIQWCTVCVCACMWWGGQGSRRHIYCYGLFLKLKLRSSICTMEFRAPAAPSLFPWHSRALHEWFHTLGLSHSKYFSAMEPLYTQQMRLLSICRLLPAEYISNWFIRKWFVVVQQMIIHRFQFNKLDWNQITWTHSLCCRKWKDVIMTGNKNILGSRWLCFQKVWKGY